jgi:hypothetical protein
MAKFYSFHNGALKRGIDAAVLDRCIIVPHGTPVSEDLPSFIKLVAEHPVYAIKEAYGVHSVCLSEGTVSMSSYNNGQIAVIGHDPSSMGNNTIHTLVSISTLAAWLISAQDEHTDGNISVVEGQPRLVAYGLDKHPMIIKNQPNVLVPMAAYLMHQGDRIEILTTDGSLYELKCIGRGRVSVRLSGEPE